MDHIGPRHWDEAFVPTSQPKIQVVGFARAPKRHIPVARLKIDVYIEVPAGFIEAKDRPHRALNPPLRLSQLVGCDLPICMDEVRVHHQQDDPCLAVGLGKSSLFHLRRIRGRQGIVFRFLKPFVFAKARHRDSRRFRRRLGRIGPGKCSYRFQHPADRGLDLDDQLCQAPRPHMSPARLEIPPFQPAIRAL